MRTPRLLALCLAAQALAPAVFAAAAKTYQVTGPIVALTPTTITVEKNGEKWEIARDEKTKNASELQVGQKVVVHYRMFATTVESERKEADPPESKKVEKESRKAK